MSKGGSGRGGGGGTTTTVQKADPWSGLQGPLSNLYQGAQNWFAGSSPQYYPGNTVAPQNNNIAQALNMGASTAMAPTNPLFGVAQNSLWDSAASLQNPWAAMSQNPGTGILNNISQGQLVGQNPSQGYFTEEQNGKYLTNQTNPYLNGVYNAASRPVVDQFKNAIAPALASQFSAAGRTGSGAAQGAFGQATQSLGNTLGDLSSNLFGNAYSQERQLQQQGATNLAGINEAERANQLGAANSLTNQFENQQQLGQQASLNAPAFASSLQQYGLNNANALMGIGQYQQSYDQDLINAAMDRYNFGQNLPLSKLQSLNQLLQGGMALNGQQSTNNSSLNRNPFAGVMGGGLVGSAVGNALGGIGLQGLGNYGGLAGAVLGGLFG